MSTKAGRQTCSICGFKSVSRLEFIEHACTDFYTIKQAAQIFRGELQRLSTVITRLNSGVEVRCDNANIQRDYNRKLEDCHNKLCAAELAISEVIRVLER